MIIVIGLAVTERTCSRMPAPNPGSFVSTSTTPDAAMKTVVFPLTVLDEEPVPRPPVITKRLSLTFSI